MIRNYILAVLLFTIPISVKAQNQEALFEKSLLTLNDMLVNESHYSFKKAVFSVENAYLNGKLDSLAVNGQIKVLKELCSLLINGRFLAYVESDKPDVNKWASVYQVMCDSIPIIIKDQEYRYIPFRYDFDDVFGNQELSNMFVSKLLITRKGNCHSLPYLYKILCEELGTTANLALAPNHIYIKHQNKKNGWYNTELTSGIFPNDAWLMASGFIHVDAIKNGVYMKALNNKESIALVMMDLADAYQKTFPNNDGSFLLNCSQTALSVFPNLTSALIMRAEIHKKQIEKETNIDKAKQDFKKLEIEYSHIHKLGYRYMPEEMYLNWLVSLKTEREKYENKKLTNFNKK